MTAAWASVELVVGAAFAVVPGFLSTHSTAVELRHRPSSALVACDKLSAMICSLIMLDQLSCWTSAVQTASTPGRTGEQ